MRKLTDIEKTAYRALILQGSLLIGDDELRPVARILMRNIMDSLVKKKFATVEATDDGPRYHAIVRAA